MLQQAAQGGQSFQQGGQSFQGKGKKGGGGAPAMMQNLMPRRGAEGGVQKKFAMEGPGGGPKAMGSVGGATAEVRFDSPADAQKALQLNGSSMGGCVITVEYDETSKDGSKVIVKNVPKEAEWQELKDHFAQCGAVAFANVKGGGKGNKGPAVGSIRYATAEEAAGALAMFNGAIMGDSTLEVKLHPGSSDQSKLQIFGLPPSCEWQELKDFFGQAGTVAFSEVIRSSGNGKQVGEVRFEDPACAQQAQLLLNGSSIGGAEIAVKVDLTSKDGTKIIVTGIPLGIEWQELKDHFGAVGTVAFCNVKSINAMGKGKGGGKGMNMMGGNMMGGAGNNLEAMLLQALAGQAGGQITNNMKGGGFAGGPTTATVRYDNPLHCHFAIQLLNGTEINGGAIQVEFDNTSQDGSKLCIGGLIPGTQWQEVKDHFAAVGPVAFCQVGPGKGKGKGKGAF